MCAWVGPHAPACGRQLWGLPSRMEYLSAQGVSLPQVYGTTASPLWVELRGPDAWQATRSWDVCRHTCHHEAGSDPGGHLWVTWGVYLWAGKPPLADIILSHPADLP